MKKWYESYINFPYKHLGKNPETGIDCFNLCCYVYENELGIKLPYSTADFCNIIDENWYSKTNMQLFHKGFTDPKNGWTKVSEPKEYDIILMSIGSTNVTNHCALYLGDGKILQIMLSRTSGVYPYRGFFKQYTTGIYRWNSFLNS